jgi:hypothetical protein
MPTRATPCVGYWAAYYINRNGDWSVACDALLGHALSPSSPPPILRMTALPTAAIRRSNVMECLTASNKIPGRSN